MFPLEATECLTFYLSVGPYELFLSMLVCPRLWFSAGSYVVGSFQVQHR